MSEPKAYRWYQFRLRFLLIVIPLGSIILGIPWAQILQHERDQAFYRELEGLHPQEDIRADARVIRAIIKRRILVVNLPHRLLAVSSINNNRLFCLGLIFHLNNDMEIIGVVDPNSSLSRSDGAALRMRSTS